MEPTSYTSSAPEHLKRLNAALALREIPDYPASLDQLQKALRLAPTDASIHLLLGLTYQDIGKQAEAKYYLEQALQYDAGSTEAQEALGLLLVQQNQMAEAVGILQPLIDADLHNPTIWQALATAMKGLGDQESALIVLQKAYQRWPDDSSIKNQLGHLLVENNRPEEAIPVLEDVVAVRSSTGSLIDLATAYVMQQKYDVALHLLERAIRRTPDSSQAWRGIAYCYLHLDDLAAAEEAARKAVEFDNQHFRSWHILAAVLVAAGKIGEALPIIKTGLNLVQQVENGKSVQQDLARLHAIALLYQEGPQVSLQKIMQDLETDPDNLMLWQLRKDIELALGMYRQALESSRRLMVAGFPTIRFAGDLYHIYHGLNQPEEAWQAVAPFLAQPEEKPSVLEQMERAGHRLYNDDQPEAARAVFRQLLCLQPKSGNWANNVGFLAAGFGEWEQAEALIQQAYDAGFEPYMALTNLGYIYLRQQRLTESIISLQQALNLAHGDEAILRIACWYKGAFSDTLYELFPKQPLPINLVIQANLATAYFLAGDVEKALATAQAGIESAPTLAVGYRVRGAIEFTAGQVENAYQSWQRGLTAYAPPWEKHLLEDWLADLH